MARVEDWFGGFVVEHLARCQRLDWPDASQETGRVFYATWLEAFKNRGLELRFLEKASLEVAIEPPRFLDGHLPMLVRLSLEFRAKDDAAKPRVAVEVGSLPPALPPPDAPEWQIRTPADLKRFCASLAGSFSVGRAFTPSHPRTPHHGNARAIAARSELADAIPDPVIDRERARPAPKQPAPQSLSIPEDHAADAWL